MKREEKGKNYGVKKALDRQENSTCCGAEARFERKVGQLVEQVKGTTPQTHDAKAAELKTAFDKKINKK